MNNILSIYMLIEVLFTLGIVLFGKGRVGSLGGVFMWFVFVAMLIAQTLGALGMLSRKKWAYWLSLIVLGIRLIRVQIGSFRIGFTIGFNFFLHMKITGGNLMVSINLVAFFIILLLVTKITTVPVAKTQS